MTTAACTAEWVDLAGCYPVGPHHCTRTPGHVHMCACGAFLDDRDCHIVPVATADSVLMQPLEPGTIAGLLGYLPTLSPLTLSAIEAAALACLAPDDERLPA